MSSCWDRRIFNLLHSYLLPFGRLIAPLLIDRIRSHMDMHRQLLMRKEDQISRHKRGEDLGHYANGLHLTTLCYHDKSPKMLWREPLTVSSATLPFSLLIKVGVQNHLPSANGMQADRDIPHSEDHVQGYSNYSYPALDCNLLIIGGAIQNPSALGTTRSPIPLSYPLSSVVVSGKTDPTNIESFHFSTNIWTVRYWLLLLFHKSRHRSVSFTFTSNGRRARCNVHRRQEHLRC